MTRQPGRRFPDQIINRRTREAFDLDTSGACCPYCGFQLVDPAYIREIPKPGSWFSTTPAFCEHCHATYHVRLIETKHR